MHNFSWAKAIGFGVLLWAILFVVAAIMAGLGVAVTAWSVFVLAIIAGGLAFSFTVGARPANSAQAFGYGFVWMAAGLVLDLIITQQLRSAIFGFWSYWLGYVLVLVAPWLEHELENTGTSGQARRHASGGQPV